MKSSLNKFEDFSWQMVCSPLMMAAGFCVLACLMGIGIGVYGSVSQTGLIGITLGIAGVFGLVFLIVYDLPLVLLARVLFIASLFFKTDAVIFKIDEIEDTSGLNVSLTLLVAAVLFLSDFFDRENKKVMNVFPWTFSVVLLALIVCVALSALYGTIGLLGWFGFLSFLSTCFICYVTASHFSRRERLKELVIGIGIGLSFTGLASISQFLFDFPKMPFLGTGNADELLWTQAEVFSRVSAFLRTPTEMGWVVSTLIPIVFVPIICYIREFTGKQRFILAVSVGLGIAAIILSLARGSWVAFVFSTLILIALAWKTWELNERKNYFVAVGGLVMLCALVLAPFGGRIYERLTTDDGDSAAIRIPLMQVAFNIIKDNPLVGVGLNSYRRTMRKYDDTSVHITQVFPGTVHNSFAHITAEIGIPGGIFFGLLLAIAVFECWQTMFSRDKLLFALGLGAFAAITAYTISAIKEPGGLGSVRPPMRICFLLLGLIMALSYCRRFDESESVKS